MNTAPQTVTAVAAQLTVLIPLGFAAVGLAFGDRPGWPAAWGRTGALGALIVAVMELHGVLTQGPVASIPLLGSADLGSVQVTLALRADQLSALVAVAVGVVAFCVQVYSVGYFAGHDRPSHPARYSGYAAAVSLFTAAMMLVIHADDLLVLLIGWEVMGACSYLLVGHHSERRTARSAAMKAFLITRAGDVGVVLAVATLLGAARTTSITKINTLALDGGLGRSTATAAALLALAGVVGKSAQVPLQAWLPDAMEGPTPVSALIHAATMVAAGVFLVVRLLPVYLAAPAALTTAAVIAAVTMSIAAFAALAQDDLKRLLAWSTVSQVGYMLAAVSLARTPDDAGPAVFHLLMHAAFKGLLFLVAGVVIALYGTTAMGRMGGLRASHPRVAGLLALGLAALAGIVPLSGFWSKEGVLGLAEDRVSGAVHSYATASDGAARWAVLLVLGSALLTALLTGMYATRAYVLVATGEPVVDRAEQAPEPAEPGHVTQVPGSMIWPLWLLAIPTAFGGLILLDPPSLLAQIHIGPLTALTGTVLAVVGALWAASAPRLGTRDISMAIPTRLRVWLRNGYDVDPLTDAVVVRPYRAVARGVRVGDHDVVDAYPRGAVVLIRWGGRLLQQLETGLATAYVGWVIIGALLLGLAGVVLS